LRDVVTVAVTSSEGTSGADLDAFVARLPENEQRRATAMRLDSRRRSFVLGRTLLRAAVARAAGVPPENVRVEIEPGGRPVLSGALSKFFVSIAHSGRYVVVAVAKRPVGVDVELLRHSPRFQQVAARVCSPAQLQMLAHSHGSDRDRAFLTMWARKEAYGKAQGLGLDFPVRSVTVGGKVAGGDGRGRTWRTRKVDVDPAYVAAVAAPGRIWRVRLDRIDRTSL
jgi:4'-phosphopantetheinyl transferase